MWSTLIFVLLILETGFKRTCLLLFFSFSFFFSLAIPVNVTCFNRSHGKKETGYIYAHELKSVANNTMHICHYSLIYHWPEITLTGGVDNNHTRWTEIVHYLHSYTDRHTNTRTHTDYRHTNTLITHRSDNDNREPGRLNSSSAFS